MSVPAGFAPINPDQYVELHLSPNPDADRAEVRAQLEYAIDAHRKGIRCDCGAPIWILGSAFSRMACFTCLTLEAVPDNDYEIDTTRS